MSKILLVALGGGTGAVLRYLTGVWAVRVLGPAFPWGTFIVNVAGSFAMGVLAVLLIEKGVGARWAPLVLTGLLGGFTTFSAYSLDALSLFEQGRAGAFLAYVGGSVALSLLACLIGVWLARGLA